MDPRNISGPLKAAILLRSLGPEVAGRILKTLSESEKKVL
jgi:flagellar motor switch protein FliG